MRLWMKKHGRGLYPDSTESNDVFDKLPFDVSLQIDAKQPRNPKFSRLYWVLCARIGSGIGKDRLWVSDAFKVETGLVTVFNYGGKAHLVLGKTSDMDEVAFKAYFEQCLQVAYGTWRIDPASIADIVAPEESQKHG